MATLVTPTSPFTGKVLIVDDEPDVLDFCVQCISHYGFTPLAARDGLEALEIFRQQPGEFQFVILDMTMPRMDGPTTFKELRRINPDIRVIISTGHSAQNTTMSFTDGKPNAFIQKPYQPEDLLNKIHEIM